MLPKTSEHKPFVGLPGNANVLKVDRAGGRTTCRLNPMVKTVVYVAAAVFAGVGVVFAFQAGQMLGWWILAAEIPSLALAGWMIHRFVGSRRLEIAPSRRELAFHDGSPFPVHRLRKSDIRDSRIQTVTYEGENAACENHILALETKDGETAWLALSTDAALIQGLLDDCRKAL